MLTVDIMRFEPEHAEELRADLADAGTKVIVGPTGLKTSLVLDNGTLIGFRPIHPTDEPRMRELFYALSRQTIYYRFFQYMKRIPQTELHRFVFVDHRNEIAIVATLPETYGEEILAVGRYYVDQKSNRAEVAFVVRDIWQNRGIGRFLLKYLSGIAKRHGISGFTAEVLRENKPMQAVFNRADGQVNSKLRQDVYSYTIDFA